MTRRFLAPLLAVSFLAGPALAQFAYGPSIGGGSGATSTAGDCSSTYATSVLTLTCTKAGGVVFAASATTDATNATNISSGTLPLARFGSVSAGLFLGGPVTGSATPTFRFISSADMPAASGDCTSVAGTFTLTCNTYNGGTSFGTFAAQNYATPPAIGGTTPNAGAFSSLTDTGMTGGPYCVHETAGVLSSASMDCNILAATPKFPGSTALSTTSTSSTTAVMAGFGSTLSITPAKTGRIEAIGYCNVQQTTAAQTNGYQFYYGTGTAPTSLTAASGTALGFIITSKPASSGIPQMAPVLIAGISGLTIGTAYWFDIGFYTGNGSDALALNACAVSLKELG